MIARILLSIFAFLFAGASSATCDEVAKYCTTSSEAYTNAWRDGPTQAQLDVMGSPSGRPVSYAVEKAAGENRFAGYCVNKTGGGKTACGGSWRYGTVDCEDSTETAKMGFDGTGTPPADGFTFCAYGCSYKNQYTQIVVPVSGGGWSATGIFRGVGTVGTVCSDPNPVTKTYTGSKLESERCVAQGSLSQCYDPQTGQNCVISPKGNKYCWSPGESGAKVSTAEDESVTREPAPTVSAPPSGLTNAETVHTDTKDTPTSGGPTSTTTINSTLANQTGTVPGGTGESAGSGNGDVVAAVNGVQGAVNNVNATLNSKLDGAGAGDDGDTSTPTTESLWSTLGGEGISQDGLGFGQDLPPLPTITVAGVTYTIPYQDELADLVGLIRLLIIAAAMIYAVSIIRGAA